MQTIHQAKGGQISFRLVQRRGDFVIVADDGEKFAALDPRGSDRAHAVNCWIEAIDLAETSNEPLLTVLLKINGA